MLSCYNMLMNGQAACLVLQNNLLQLLNTSIKVPQLSEAEMLCAAQVGEIQKLTAQSPGSLAPQLPLQPMQTLAQTPRPYRAPPCLPPPPPLTPCRTPKPSAEPLAPTPCHPRQSQSSLSFRRLPPRGLPSGGTTITSCRQGPCQTAKPSPSPSAPTPSPRSRSRSFQCSRRLPPRGLGDSASVPSARCRPRWEAAAGSWRQLWVRLPPSQPRVTQLPMSRL